MTLLNYYQRNYKQYISRKKKHIRDTEGNTTYTNTTLIGHKEGCVIKVKTVQEILEIILVHVHNQIVRRLRTSH